MKTVSDFIRYIREQVIETPDVAGYEITLLIDADNSREAVEDWFVDHQMKQVVIVAREEVPGDTFDDDYFGDD